MNGLEIIDLKEANFMQRLLKREPRENAFFEINNLLASVPILELDKASIESRLAKHGVSHEEARSRLNNFYSIILKYFLRDWELTNKQRERLAHLQTILGLEKNEVSSINSATIYPVYRNYVRKKVSDGGFSTEERQQADQLANQLGLPETFALEIYKSEASEYLHSVLKLSLSDGMLSDGEELELEKIARNLGVELKFSENAKRNLERCRHLWKLYTGDLPEVLTPIRLPKKEKCFGFLQAKHYEVSRKKTPVKYSGFDVSIQKNAFVFHAGNIGQNIGPTVTKRFMDEGTLYFNGNRLFFHGGSRSKQFRYKNLIGGTFYQNGLLIEQLRGRDQFFQFSGDMHSFKLIFDSLITKSRK